MELIEMGIDTKGRTGNIKIKCPECSHERKHKSDPCLSVDTEKKVWNCHHCGFSGCVPTKKLDYTTPQANDQPLATKAEQWFIDERGISKNTLERFGVSQSDVGGKAWINFNYYLHGKLVNIKKRSSSKQFQLSKGGLMSLYNIDNARQYDEIIICEGEIDALSFYEASPNLINVVSVPNGASKGSNNLQYIDNNSHLLTGKKWIIATDNDEAGNALEAELLKRFGRDNCKKLNLGKYNDPNECLLKEGKDGLKARVENAQPYPLPEIEYLNEDKARQMLNEFDNGIELAETTHFETIDPHFRWLRGDVNVLTGIPNMGKSEIMNNLMMIKSIKSGTKWVVFTPEAYPSNYYYNNLIHTYIGQNVDPQYPDRMDKLTYIKGMEFVGNHFFYISLDAAKLTLDYILETFNKMRLQHGVDGLLIDPWNQLDHESLKKGEYEYLSKALAKCKRFAQDRDVYFNIVCHPPKMSIITDDKSPLKGCYKMPNIYDLAGGSMWANKCDNIMVFHRPLFPLNKETTESILSVEKIKKQKIVGKPGEVTIEFNRSSNRFNELTATSRIDPFKR